MKYLRLTILISGFLLLAAFAGVKTINAVDCSPTVNGAINTVSASCSFAGTIDGVDYGTGTTNTAILKPETGATITVSASQILATGSIDLSGGGSFVIINTGQIKLNAPLYITDADADGYPANTTLYISLASGRVRRSSLISMTLDCNDAAYSAANTCCTDTWVCDTCYNTCCATCCTEHQNCGGTCSGCASGPFAGCSNYDVWNAAHTCYCSYCQINYSCEPCVSCNPYSCNCRWECI